MTTRRDITWRQGALLSELLATDTDLTGRSLRCHVRRRKSDSTIMLAFSSAGPADQRLDIEAEGVRITLGAVAGEGVQTGGRDQPWVYDVEAVLDADPEDVIRTHEGAWIVSADVTRSGTQSDPTPDADLRYVRYDGAQSLTGGDQTQARSNIGAEAAGTAAGAVSAHADATSGVHGISAFGAQLVDDADASAARATLGLGAAATRAIGTSAGQIRDAADPAYTDARTPLAHTHPADQISDSTAAGRALLTAADAAAQRTALDVSQRGVIRESSGPTDLSVGAIADGQPGVRIGNTFVGMAGASWDAGTGRLTLPAALVLPSSGTLLISGSNNLLSVVVNNTALGTNAQFSVTTGENNTAIGSLSQYSLTIGNGNNAFGYSTQLNLTTGSNNNAFGENSQSSLTTGNNNNAFGLLSQLSLTTGSNNNGFGFFSQNTLTTGSSNTAFGHNAQHSSPSVNSETVIGAGAVGRGANTVTLGGPAETAVMYRVRVYNGWTDASNGEWLSIDWSSNVCTIAPAANGTGAVRPLVVRHPPVTLATLPAAGTAGAGARSVISDSTVAMSGNFGAIAEGGGANMCPVISDGTNWRIG